MKEGCAFIVIAAYTLAAIFVWSCITELGKWLF